MRSKNVLTLLCIYLLGNAIAQAAAAGALNTPKRLRGQSKTSNPTPTPTKDQPSTKPNFVFLMSDDMRAVDMYPYAVNPLKLPNLLKLAQQSTAFDAYTAYPVCGPSRAVMLTGNRNVLTFDNSYLSSGYRPFPEVLRTEGGYYGGIFGKFNHPFPDTEDHAQIEYYTNQTDVLNLPPVPGNSDCKGDYIGCVISTSQSTDAKVTANGIEFLKQVAKLKTAGKIENFFVAFGWHHTHVQWASQQRNPEFYTRPLSDLTAPNINSGAEPPLAHKDCSSEMGNYKLSGPGKDQKIVSGAITSVDQLYKDPPKVQYIRGQYFDAQYALDENVGAVLKAVDDLGLAENAYVIFTSDHGWLSGEKNAYCKGMLYEEAMRIPLLIRKPPNSDGSYAPEVVAETLVSNLDTAPTILALAFGPTWVQNFHHPNGKSFQGNSLVPALINPSVVVNQVVFSSYGRCQPSTKEQSNPCTSDTVPNSCDRPYFSNMLHAAIYKTAQQVCQNNFVWPFVEVRFPGAAGCAKPTWANQAPHLKGYGYVAPQIDLGASHTDFTHVPFQLEMYCYQRDALYGAADHPNVDNLALNPNSEQAALIAQAAHQIQANFQRLAI